MTIMPRNNLILLLAATALCGFYGITPAFAADEKPVAESTPAEEKNPLLQIESQEKRGLYIRSADGSLGPDIWKDSRRSKITKYFEDLQTASPEPTVQKLMHGILLTQNQGGIENDTKDGKTPDSIFTIRLKKLLDTGLYEEALLLYGQLQDDPETASLAYTGTLALLFSNDRSSGCIEARAAQQNFPESELLKPLTAYCDRPAATPAIYTPDAFKDYSEEKLATIIGDATLDASRLTPATIKEVPTQHIRLLQKSTNLSDENRFALNMHAVHWGLMTVGQLKDYYEEIGAQPDAATAKWKKPAFTYVKAEQAAEAQRWNIIREILLQDKEYGIESLLPFAEMLEDIKPLGINYDELVQASRILIRGGIKIPPQWAEIIRESINPDTIRPYDSVLLGLAYLSETPSERSGENKQKIFDILKSLKNKENFIVNYIIENIDKRGANVNNGLRVYEKDYRLTFEHDYVMPSEYVWHQLQDVSQESNIGETVLLSTLALGDKKLTDVNPDVLVTVLKALEKVGLTDTAERLALATLIDGTFKGEN